jgi:hypothetical protein
MFPNGATTGGAGGATTAPGGAGATGAVAGGTATTGAGVSFGQIKIRSPDGSMRGTCQLAQPAAVIAQHIRAPARMRTGFRNSDNIPGAVHAGHVPIRKRPDSNSPAACFNTRRKLTARPSRRNLAQRMPAPARRAQSTSLLKLTAWRSLTLPNHNAVW